MKRFQSILTTLVVLQVTMVLLLGVMTILTFQNQTEVHQLLTNLQAQQGNGDDEDSKAPTAAWMAEVEARTGMRDPDADKISRELSQQMAQANALDQQFNQLKSGSAATPPPPPILSGASGNQDPSAAIDENLTPAQRAIAALPTVAGIALYDEEWEFWTVDKGRFGGMKEGDEYAIRRQDKTGLVGNIRVTTVHPQEAIVELVPNTLKDPNVRPAIGDTLVDTSQLQ